MNIELRMMNLLYCILKDIFSQGAMEQVIEKIQELLADMRPAFQRDRGDIEFVSFDPETGIVKVRLLGMCRGCGLSELTLKMGVEAILKEQLPAVKEVIPLVES